MAQQLWPKIFINKRSNRQYFPGISQVPREGPWEMRHGTILPPAAARRGNALDPPNERWQQKQRQRSGGATQWNISFIYTYVI